MNGFVLIFVASVLLLTACGGEPRGGSSSSSSTSSSSSASSSSSSSGGRLVGDPSRGAALWAKHCSDCHAAFYAGVSLGIAGVYSTIVAANVADKYSGSLTQGAHKSLEDYISSAMPPKNAKLCGLDGCAQDVTAYIKNQRPLFTSNICGLEPAGTAAGPLTVISAHEYQYVLEQLLHVGSDFGLRIAPFSGQPLFDAANSKQRMALACETFYRNALEIAVSSKPINCNKLTGYECGEKFVDGFVSLLFKRSLNLNERESYIRLIGSADTATAGLELALVRALSSPHFIFRREFSDVQQ